MRPRCTCTGDPQRDPCRWCARRIERAETAESHPDAWQGDQDRYERWLAEITL